jgi:large subunit ribosomal protein L23
MKSPTDIIIKPLLVEKVMREQKKKKYAFLVARNANKKEIRWAVEKMFKVKVQSVSTIIMRSKPKRTRLIPSRTPERKKAIISLQPGQRIDILENL